MRNDFLPFPTERADPPPARPPADPDPGFAAVGRFARLRDALAADARTRRPPAPWRVPPLFFFDPARQAECAAARPPAPAAAARLDAQIARELPALLASAEARHAARAVPGLREQAAAAAPHAPAAGRLAELLALLDDEIVLALCPATRTGYRLAARGVADVAQFHTLLADALPDGPPPPVRAAAVARGVAPPTDDPPVMVARFQLFAPAALRPDGTLPSGFGGCSHWLWGGWAAGRLPRVDGERVVLLGDPAYPASWEVEPRFPGLAADLTLLDTLSPAAVAERLARLGGPAVASEPAALPRAA